MSVHSSPCLAYLTFRSGHGLQIQRKHSRDVATSDEDDPKEREPAAKRQHTAILDLGIPREGNNDDHQTVELVVHPNFLPSPAERVLLVTLRQNSYPTPQSGRGNPQNSLTASTGWSQRFILWEIGPYWITTDHEVKLDEWHDGEKMGDTLAVPVEDNGEKADARGVGIGDDGRTGTIRGGRSAEEENEDEDENDDWVRNRNSEKLLAQPGVHVDALGDDDMSISDSDDESEARRTAKEQRDREIKDLT
ncbi:hypothetical protein F4779DRAFT_617971 [Xylariaceae sp. FL0662B]|nr:hypothetical protein F4779DRAFT_617971 [Xylariaceae sp. FL0662B]